MTEVNALVLTKEDLSYVISKDKEIGNKMALLAYERATQHVKRIINSLVREGRVKEFAKRVYPDAAIKRKTAAEFLRKLIRNYLENKPAALNNNERIMLRSLNDEEELRSSKIPQIQVEPPSAKETEQIEQIKFNREKSKYEDDLLNMQKHAKHIQTSALRIKTNNRMINNRLLDIQETDRLISQKNESMEDLVYRLLVRVDPQPQ